MAPLTAPLFYTCGMKPLLPLLLLLAVLFGCGSESPEEVPRKAPEKPVASFKDPVGLVADGDVLFVAEREGFVYRIEDGNKTLWADASRRVGEGGLSGIALSPDWQTDRLFYLFLQNRGGAQVLFEGSEELNQGVVRRVVLRIEDPLPSPGPLAWQGKNLIVSLGGSAQKSSWAGSLLRIRPYLGAGEAYKIPGGNSEDEIWLRGLPDVSSIASSDNKSWIVTDKALLRADAKAKYKSAKDVPVLEQNPCIRGGAVWKGDYLYGCEGEVFSWPAEAPIAKTKPIDSLWASATDVWIFSDGELWKVEL
jgi:hypothetical protein